jgi:hypothetical protein
MDEITVSCNILHFNSHPDTPEDLGIVTYFEAIEMFQSFPWETEIREMHENIGAFRQPSFIFKNNNNQILTLAGDDRGFDLTYMNGAYTFQVYLYNEITLNPDEVNVEYLIKDFFWDRLERQFSDDTTSTNEGFPEVKRYDIKTPQNHMLRFWTFVNIGIVILANAVFFVFFINLYKHDIEFLVLFEAFLFAICGPGIILWVTYHLKNKDVKIIVNPSKNTLTYINGDSLVEISKKEIATCQISTSSSHSSRRYWHDFKFLRIKLHDGRKFIITCLIADPEQICADLKWKYRQNYFYFPTLY